MKKSRMEWIETLSKLTDTQLMKLTWTRALLGGETSFMAWNINDYQDVIVDMPNTHTLREFLTAVVLELLWRCEQQPDKEYGNLLVLDIVWLKPNDGLWNIFKYSDS
jgi:hypothetical protein